MRPPEDVQRVAERLHLDEPVWQQYGRFLWQLVGEQSLGTSFVNRQDVNDIVLRAAPVTAALVFGGAIFWLTLSIPIGIISALRPRSLIDRAGMVFVLIGLSAHPVWIGLIFAYFFGFKFEHGACPHADHGLRRLLQPLAGARRARAVGVPHDPALDRPSRSSSRRSTCA